MNTCLLGRIAGLTLLLAVAWPAHAALESQISADCGPTPAVIASMNASSNCLGRYFDPVLRDHFDWRIYATGNSTQIAVDSPDGTPAPSLFAESSVFLDYYTLQSSGAGTGTTGSSPASAMARTTAQSGLVFDVVGASPTDAFTLRTRVYVDGAYTFGVQADPQNPFAAFDDGFLLLQSESAWSGFGVLADGPDPSVVLRYGSDGITGSSYLLRGDVLTLETSITSGQLRSVSLEAFARLSLKNNWSDHLGGGIGLGQLAARASAGVVGFEVLDSQGMSRAFSVTADGSPFEYYVPTPVPEPGTLALMLGGLLAVARVARRPSQG